MAFKEVMMADHKNLQDVYENLLQRNLPAAMEAMQIFLSVRPNGADIEMLNGIRNDFQLMTDYWARGYKDHQAEALYDNLLKRMYTFYIHESIVYEVNNSSLLISIYNRTQPVVGSQSIAELQKELEGFVSDVAMLEFEHEHKRRDKQKELYQRHHELMNCWFDYMIISPVWSAEQAEDMQRLLLSPTVDINDQQVLISGISIATVNHFDVYKLKVLMNVYQQSTDEAVRQRSLVGWVLAVGDEILPVLYKEEVDKIHKMLEKKEVCEELTALQQQIYLCMNAEKDNQTIQKEILPGLLNNSNFKVTRNGIEEVEDDPMEDILHPDAEERRMEELEENYRRMQSMQKQGSDIYFGGFSQMKRFTFFKDAMNWFVPFYMEHPGIAEIVDQFHTNRFLQLMMHMGPFCNSDKYSFILGFSQVVDKMPKEVMKMLEMGEASIENTFSEEMKTAAFIRRTYLQDLYRFYRLFSFKGLFRNPFEQDVSLFFANPIFSHTHLEPYMIEMASMMMKRKLIKEAAAVLDNVGEDRRNLRFYLMTGYLAQNYNCKFIFTDCPVYDCFSKALESDPENAQALNGFAKMYFGIKKYAEALNYYEKLLELYPDKKSYMLNHAVCLTKLKRYDDALKELFLLNYEQPDDKRVIKVLAWTLTCDGKYDQAIKFYSQLLSEKANAEDLLNYGYCLWFSGNVKDASDCFHSYLKETGEKKEVILDIERELIKEKEITPTEQQMMLYIL
jgi:Tfp pilus assembly protein PilF